MFFVQAVSRVITAPTFFPQSALEFYEQITKRTLHCVKNFLSKKFYEKFH